MLYHDACSYTSRLLAAMLLGAGLASTGCSFVTGDHETDAKFLVQPNSDSTFSGWSEIDVPEDPNTEAESATLLYATIEAQDQSITDLSFIQWVTAETKVDETLTLVAQKNPVPKGERIVNLDLVYDGDYRSFFYKNPENGDYTIHIVWRGQVDPNYPIPAEGIWIKVKLAVRVE